MQTLFQVNESENDQLPGTLMRVLVPFPVDKAYDYKVPAGVEAPPGAYVTVPLGKREIPGVVWGAAEGGVPAGKLKSVIAAFDVPPLPEAHRKFIDWAADYTMNPLGSVLKMSLSAPGALDPPKTAKGYKIASNLAEGHLKLTPAQRKIIDLMQDGVTRRASEIAEQAGCTPAVIKGLAAKNILQEVMIHTDAAPCRAPDFKRAGASLSADQKMVAAQLCAASANLKPILLDGVTGAGKTEVYFEAVAKALENGRQVLILLPEIALANAFMNRFKSRFGCPPALWHSNLPPGQRKSVWRGVAKGETKVIVGARSALFLPYADLGLIVVDEEHDSAFKQEEGTIYHARDMAVVRAHLGKIPIVLVSATPSLETLHNAWTGRYQHLHLPDRFGGAHLPVIQVIDMREDKPPPQNFIAPSLHVSIEQTLEAGDQVLLFLNRRGYAPLTLCRSCGHRMECPRCTAWLVEHKAGQRLQCHHCGYNARPPSQCPSCSAEDSLAACGPGVERIYEEVKARYPDRTAMLMASDTAENPEALTEMLRQIHAREVDIIIGTQIIAKGHHFPHLTCVGVIDADLGLQGAELRAAERVYQLLHQVAGRAGRAEKKGTVYLQTYMPEHRIMKALSLGERDAFLEVEAHERQQAHMPPYTRLAGIILSGREEADVLALAKQLGATAPRVEGLQTLGPAPAPFARLRGRYRYRLLVRADKKLPLQKYVAEWLAGVKIPSSIKIQIDIDPQSFF
jgi:primosomal protein N' (replication factor Y)